MNPPWRKCPNPTKGMGTNSTTFKPECHGYVGRKDMWKNCWKQGNEPSNNASRRIRTTRRIHAERERRKTKRPTQS